MVPIAVARGGSTLKLYRVAQHGRLVCECRSPEELAAVGVPLAELTEEAPEQAATPPGV